MTIKVEMGDFKVMTKCLTLLSFGRDIELMVPYLDAACIMVKNLLETARNFKKLLRMNE